MDGRTESTLPSAARRAVLACAALAAIAGAGGCGGGSSAPTVIPRPLAMSLADRSTSVARELRAGQNCQAAATAGRLRARAARAVADGRIDEALQKPLMGSIDDLLAQIRCAGKSAADMSSGGATGGGARARGGAQGSAGHGGSGGPAGSRSGGNNPVGTSGPAGTLGG